MATDEESIEQAVAARREKLRVLKAAQELLNTPDDDSAQRDDNGTTDAENLSMKFRDYVPQDKQLQEGKLAPPVLPKFEFPITEAPPPPEKKELQH
ncbi:hypothetical protein SLEP1_g17421 [Rubroshorea leprosula]|uniref:Uncharacterized protein n=1 Tax=Rubroshorea leprosula TaxID=152421 RepID=A0AAV5IZT0_9ROSI|nr:hypothetical protein SLEP1_g17421 [Rubroshorea leprosula]